MHFRTPAEARRWVADHEDDDPMTNEELEAAFKALVGRVADDEDRAEGLWSHLCHYAPTRPLEMKPKYFILVNSGMRPVSEYKCYGAFLSWHRTLEAAQKAERRVHRKALTSIQTAILGMDFIPYTSDYIGNYGGVDGFRAPKIISQSGQ